MKYPNTYFAWDLETTGFNAPADKIIEIGFIKVVNGEIKSQDSVVLNHHVEIPEKIVEITGITQQIVTDEGIDPKEAIGKFMSFMAQCHHEGVTANLTHNGIKFDIPFLVNSVLIPGDVTALRQVDMIKSMLRYPIDSAALYKGSSLNMDRHWSESFEQYALRVLNTKAYGVKFNVAHCCETLKIEIDGPLHRALADVTATHEIYQKIK